MGQRLSILSALVLLVGSCTPLKIRDLIPDKNHDWAMYGGNIERANAAQSIVTPPLSVAWEYDAAAGFSPYSTAAVGNYLFVGNLQGEVHSIDIVTGKGKGVHDFGSAVVGTPIIDTDILYVALAHDDQSLIAYDLGQGLILWTAKLGDIETSPLLIGQQLFVTTMKGRMVCIDKIKGDILWSYEVTAGGKMNVVRSSPASDGTLLFFGCDNSHLYAVDIRNGKLKWSAKTGASIVASPSVSNGKVFVGSHDNFFYAFDAGTGKELWKQSLGSKIYAPQAVDEQNIYVGTSGRTVYCLKKENGHIVWTFTAGSIINSSPLVSGNVVYVGCADKNLYALDCTTGKPLWQFIAPGRIKTMPVIWKQYLFVLSEDRSVIALKSTSTQ